MMVREPGTEYLQTGDPPPWENPPFNLFAHVDQMYSAPGATPIPPPPLFTYRKAGAPVGGTPAASVVVGFQAGYAITWNWDPVSGGWQRSKFGGPDVDADGVRLAPKNVVVMFVTYLGGAGVEGAEADLTGTGRLLVFTRGREITGTWSRPDKTKPAQLLTPAGKVIPLTPGQTWVELPDNSYSVAVTP
jgi:hypothetical protein